MLLTRIANENPAIGPLHELVDDRALVEGTRYRDAIDRLESTFADGPPIDDEGTSLLRAHAHAGAACPDLAGRPAPLRPRSRWGAFLGTRLEELIRRVDLAIGILAEEERALHLRFGGGAAVPAGPAAGRRRRPRSGPRPTSRRLSRPIRPGCRASC